MLQTEVMHTRLQTPKHFIKPTILIVDDQEMVRTMVADLLGEMNYNVLTAQDGISAISLLEEMRRSEKNNIDLVILDMILPNIDGNETYRRIKQIDPGIKVILSTGYDINNKVNELLSEGAVGFIQKPYHIDKLIGMVRQHIGIN